jgi:8-oxo-dGTP pyrophosphatase MutT (NUDIX family)
MVAAVDRDDGEECYQGALRELHGEAGRQDHLIQILTTFPPDCL